MSSEKTLLATHHQCDDGAGQGTVATSIVRIPKVSPFQRFIAHLPTGGLFNLSCSFTFACSVKDLLLGFTALPARSFEAKERLNILPRSRVRFVKCGLMKKPRAMRKRGRRYPDGYFVNERWVVG